MKKLILFIAIVISSFAFVNPINAQKHSEYLTVSVYTGIIIVAHSDGKTEKIDLPRRDFEEKESVVVLTLNRLLENGYELIQSAGKGDYRTEYIQYVFAK